MYSFLSWGILLIWKIFPLLFVVYQIPSGGTSRFRPTLSPKERHKNRRGSGFSSDPLLFLISFLALQKTSLLSTGSAFRLFFLTHVNELGVVRQPYQVNRTNGAVSLLGHNDLSDILVR